MPGKEGKKVSGNQKGKKGKGSGGAPNPLDAVMAHVPKASAKGNTKGASHTQSLDTTSSTTRGLGPQLKLLKLNIMVRVHE